MFQDIQKLMRLYIIQKLQIDIKSNKRNNVKKSIYNKKTRQKSQFQV